MLSNGNIRRKIKEYLDDGKREFVIIPYGEDGPTVKECIEEYFGIFPVKIVDNTLCQYNEKIISLEELKTMWNDRWIILLCTSNPIVENEIHKELASFIPQQSMCRISELLIPETRFNLNQFDVHVVKDTKKSMKKIRFLFDTISTWNVYASIVDACIEDDVIDPLIIVDGTQDLYGQTGMVERLRKMGISYKRIEDYDISRDCPDVLVLSHIYSNIRLGNPNTVREACGRIVVTTISVVRYGNNALEFRRLLENHFGKYLPDSYLIDTMIYRDMKNANCLTEKFVEMGNAKYDGIYLARESRDNIKAKRPWKKLIKSKRIITWILDHGIISREAEGSLRVQEDLTVDIYWKSFFSSAQNHPEIGFVFRPHSSLIKELLEFHLCTTQEMDIWKDKVSSLNNVIIDETDSYNEALAVSDALILDANCGVIASAWPLNLPICALYRSPFSPDNEPDITSHYFRADNSDKLEDFIERISSEANLNIKRENKGVVKHFDGKNGYRIKEYLKALG